MTGRNPALPRDVILFSRCPSDTFNYKFLHINSTYRLGVTPWMTASSQTLCAFWTLTTPSPSSQSRRPSPPNRHSNRLREDKISLLWAPASVHKTPTVLKGLVDRRSPPNVNVLRRNAHAMKNKSGCSQHAKLELLSAAMVILFRRQIDTTWISLATSVMANG